jgi:hypothetical protein
LCTVYVCSYIRKRFYQKLNVNFKAFSRNRILNFIDYIIQFWVLVNHLESFE